MLAFPSAPHNTCGTRHKASKINLLPPRQNSTQLTFSNLSKSVWCLKLLSICMPLESRDVMTYWLLLKNMDFTNQVPIMDRTVCISLCAIKVRRTRNAGHCWGSWNELIRDILQWTPSHGWAKAARPARTYIQQLWADTEYSLEDLPKAIDDREWWRCPWCNGYRRRKWTRRHDFKSWTMLIAFHIALIPLGKVWIQLFSLQLWVNCRADWVFTLGEGKLWIQTC